MHPQVLLAYGSPVAAALPRGWAEGLAAIAGDVGERLLPRARRTVDANLQHVLGAPPTAAARRRVFRNYAHYYLSLMRLAHLPLERAVGRVQLDGADAVQSTLARRHGALVIGAHLGNWDVAGAAFARCFGALTTYAEALPSRRLQRFYGDLRARHGVRALWVGSRSRAAVEVLRHNGLLGLLVDRAYGERAVEVPFGGASLRLPTGGIRLALRAGAGIHGFFPLRTAAGFRIEVGADLGQSVSRRDEDAAAWQVAAAFAAALANVLQRHADQWLLLQPLIATAAAPASAALRPAWLGERG